MTDEVSFEDFVNGTAAKPLVKPAAKEMSFEQFAGAPDTSNKEFTEHPLHTALAVNFDHTLSGLRRVGGEGAALVDMLLSMPGFLIGVGAQLGGTIQAGARGVDSGTPLMRPDLPTPTDQVERRYQRPIGVPSEAMRRPDAYTVGREAGREFSEPLMNPLKKYMDLFKSGKAYEDAKTTKGMEQLTTAMEEAGIWAEQHSGGKVSRDAVPMLTEVLMAGAMGIGSGKAKALAPTKETLERLREHTQRVRKESLEAAEKSAAVSELSPEEFVARVPVQQQINSMLGIRTPAEQAKVTRERRVDIKQIFKEPEEGGDFGSVAESEFKANERMGQSEALGVLQKEPEARTAQDIAMLRLGEAAVQAKAERAADKGRRVEDEFSGERISMQDAMELAQKDPESRTREENTKLRQWAGQKGNVSADALGLLAAAGIGATAGTLLDDEKLRGAVLGGAAGLGPALLMRGPGKVQNRFGQAGAVKGPGGMWHPEAVGRLADALKIRFENIQGREGDATLGERARTVDAWADKAIRNYLNKYAGTERDPLKDVEIPFEEGTKRWETLWDKSVGKANKEGILENKPEDPNHTPYHGDWSYFPEVEKAQPGEVIHQFGRFVGGAGRGSVEAITSYLSHVGDYLRQNVAADKLPQYDLVRAVRETAENDKRVAKQMEKAQSDSTKSLPVYKEYPDGFKWVELKLPEKLTEEQAKQVRPERSTLNFKGKGAVEVEFGRYEALGPDGKPIKNSYTDEVARGKTPERAWHAGILAEEGNTMGHCVGGYCESVASGESKIYSLRDQKGKSHVTVEITPTQKLIDPQVIAEHLTKEHPELHGRVSRILREAPSNIKALEKINADPEIASILEKDFPENIEQIKGKQNRAPSKEYLPYVQDFVKSGKWGEVGDLQNTNLIDRNSVHLDDLRNWRDGQMLGKLTPEQGAAAKQALEAGPRYWTKEEYNTFLKEHSSGGVPGQGFTRRRGEEGKISQDMVVGLTGLGLGGIAGWAMSNDPSGVLLGALAGGSLGIPGARARLKAAADAADYGLGSLSTRIGNISESLKLRGREYERRVLTESHAWLTKVVPFMRELKKIGGEKGEELQRAILTNDKEQIAKLIQGNQPLVAAWRQTQNVLKDLGEQLQGHGRFKTMLDDYFPRLVKDVDGLKEALDIPQRTRLEQALIEGERAAMKNRGTPMTQVEQSSIINREIQGFRRAKGYQPGFAKQRGVEEITEKLQPFYHTPQESLYAYVQGAVQDLELARFFGKDLAQTKIGGQQHINVETSIGNLVGREIAERKMTPVQANELINMLQSRFQGGERASSRLVQEVRNLGNLGLLGNIVSAATQLGDVATSIYAQGLRPAITALVRQATGEAKLSAKDFGLADHIAEEFVSPTKTAQWLNTAFKLSGFTAIDRFGKTTLLNSALSRVEKLSRTNEGISKLSTQYGEAFGKEFPALIGDLKAGRLTERVRSLLFSELSDVQPISKMEMPQGYLDNPNGRLVYMLKTFMLKQADMMRRDVYNQAKEGNIGTAVKNATSYALVLGLSGATTDMIKDWLLGRNPHFDKGDVLENVLKTFGWSEYTRANFKKAPVKAIANAVMPPYQMIDQIITRDPKAVQYIPLVGKLYYSWELGGKEANEIARAKSTGAELSDKAIEYRRQRRLRNKQE